MAVFWVVSTHTLVEVHRRFREACSATALMTKAGSTSETPLNFYRTTRRYSQEKSHFQNIRHKNITVSKKDFFSGTVVKEDQAVKLPHVHFLKRIRKN
jgi:hypothetical protein